MNVQPTCGTQHISPPALPVYRAVIDHIVMTGDIPTDEMIADRTGLPPHHVAALRIDLIEQDWFAQDDDGNLAAVYPFAASPTGITVALDGTTRHAICAIDALGVAAMLGRTTRISGACAECGASIAITASPQALEAWTPAGAVVTARCASGAANQTRCHVMRFACSADHGRQWLEAHGAPNDLVLPIEQAAVFARQQFVDCYTEGRCVKPFDRVI